MMNFLLKSPHQHLNHSLRSFSEQFLTKKSPFPIYFFWRARFFIFRLTKIKSLKSWLAIFLLLLNFCLFKIIIKFLSCPLISTFKLCSKVIVSLNFNISWFRKIISLFKLVCYYMRLLVEFSIWLTQLRVIEIFSFLKLIVVIRKLRMNFSRYAWHISSKVWNRTRRIFSHED